MDKKTLDALKPNANQVLLKNINTGRYMKMSKRAFKMVAPNKTFSKKNPKDMDGWIIADWKKLAHDVDTSQTPPEALDSLKRPQLDAIAEELDLNPSDYSKKSEIIEAIQKSQ